MDNQRLLIWAFFGLMAWMTYQTWIHDYAQSPPAASTGEQVEQPALLDGSTDLPEMTALPAAELDAPRPAEQPRPNQAPTAPSIHVSTDVFDLEISTQGGTLQSAILLAYPVAKDQPDKLVQLLSTDDANFGLIQTGLRFPFRSFACRW